MLVAGDKPGARKTRTTPAMQSSVHGPHSVRLNSAYDLLLGDSVQGASAVQF